MHCTAVVVQMIDLSIDAFLILIESHAQVYNSVFPCDLYHFPDHGSGPHRLKAQSFIFSVVQEVKSWQETR